MIVAGQRVPILIATKPVDFRCGHQALALIVQTELKLDPYSGVTVVFRSKRGDRLKILVWDGTGMVLIYKVLEQGSFAWPKVQDGTIRLSRAQAEALFEGLDWRRVVAQRVLPPAAAGKTWSSAACTFPISPSGTRSMRSTLPSSAAISPPASSSPPGRCTTAHWSRSKPSLN